MNSEPTKNTNLLFKSWRLRLTVTKLTAWKHITRY